LIVFTKSSFEIYTFQYFSKITAHQYLTSVAPLTEAVMPTKILKHNRHLDSNLP
jgi:GntR family histidine utilization transcriptional repressor